jgi:hypothetical protein
MKSHLYLCLLLAFVFLLSACCDDDGTPVPSPGPNPSTYTNHHISANGGTYTIDQNFVITVPAGAVPSDTTISVVKLGTQAMKAVFTNYGVADFPVVAGFDLQPAGLTFSKPVTFTFKSLTHTAAYVPFTHTVNLSDKTHSIDSSITIVDNMNDSLCISVVRSGSYIVEALRNWPGGLAKYSRIAGCKEGVIKVEASDKDVQCISPSQDCQTLESKVKVQFLTCNGQPIESVIIRENIGECKATLTLISGASAISKNSFTSINALIKAGCAGVDAQTITLNIDGPATINPGSVQTNSEGKASATLSSGNTTGTATVTANAMVRVPVKEIIVNGSVEDAFYRKEPVNAQTSVKITDLPTWHVVLDVNLINATSSVKGFLFDENVNYSANLEFDVSLDTSGNNSIFTSFINGSQTIGIRAINIDPHIISTNVTYDYAPSTIQCEINAVYLNGEGIIFVRPNLSVNIFFAEWSIHYVYCIDLLEEMCFEDSVGGFIDDFNACVENHTFKFPVNQDSYTVNGCFKTGLYDGTYTMTVTKKETP